MKCKTQYCGGSISPPEYNELTYKWERKCNLCGVEYDENGEPIKAEWREPDKGVGAHYGGRQ